MLGKGPDNLSDTELLAIVLRTGYHGKDALALAQTLLHKSTLAQLLALPLAKLGAIKGLGLTRAAELLAAFALTKRLLIPIVQPIIDTPKEVAKLAQPLTNKKQEYLLALYLNARHQLISQEIISIGTVSQSLIHPREVFAPALELRAAEVIIVHNHPSGDTQPSEEDILATQKIQEAGEILDVPLIDHIIVAKSSWTSLRQLKLM